MKTILLIGCFLLFGSGALFAQQFQGKAIYQSQIRLKVSKDSLNKNAIDISKKIGKEASKKIQAALKDALHRKYMLKFNTTESTYGELQKLDKPKPSVGTTVVSVHISFGGGDSGSSYRNIAKKVGLSEESILGKAFLVKDSLEKPDWTLVNESKKIGRYICFKATLTKEVEVTDVNFLSTDSTAHKTHTEKRVTTAWYTPQIPVHLGPGKYWGLPGLILEIEKENYSLLCIKIVLDPDKKIKLEVPDTGKEISREKFDKLQKKKMAEWAKRHSSGNGAIIIKKD